METVKQENTQAQISEPAEDKTFTQAEVDQIVKERIGRERAKYEGYEEFKEKASKFDELEEANKTELQKAQDEAAALKKKLSDLENENTMRVMREKVATEKGVPIELLTGETEEACITQADGILKFASSNGYPIIKDGGEPHKTTHSSTRDQFKEFMNNNFPD